MRHIYLLIVLLTACLSSFASGGTTMYYVSQTNWRWRNNNGSETSATWKAAQNAAVSFNGKGVIRLRIEIVNTSTTTNCGMPEPCSPRPISATLIDTLEYSATPSVASSWQRISFDTSKAFIIGGAGNRLTEGQATTAQLTDTAYTFSPGKVLVRDTVLKNTSVPGNDRTEFEISLKATKHLLPNTTYYFRLDNRISPIYYANQQYPIGYPTVTTPAKVSASALEEDISVPALTMSVNNVLSVVPNPAHAAIAFKLATGAAAKEAEAILTDASGRVIYRQMFANLQSNTLYRLALVQMPAPGLYILKVTGNGFSESSKVMVQ